MNFNSMPIPVPIPLALAVVALIGFVFGRKSKRPAGDMPGRSRRDLRRASLWRPNWKRSPGTFARPWCGIMPA